MDQHNRQNLRFKGVRKRCRNYIRGCLHLWPSQKAQRTEIWKHSKQNNAKYECSVNIYLFPSADVCSCQSEEVCSEDLGCAFVVWNFKKDKRKIWARKVHDQHDLEWTFFLQSNECYVQFARIKKNQNGKSNEMGMECNKWGSQFLFRCLHENGRKERKRNINSILIFNLVSYALECTQCNIILFTFFIFW